MARTSGLVLGILLTGCAREAPPQSAPAAPTRSAPVLGEPCALSPLPQAPSKPPRIIVELATLEGDLAAIQKPIAAEGSGVATPRTFSQVLADPRWRTISVRHLLASDGVRQTLPWDLEPPSNSACPASERWDLNVTPQVTGQSPVMISIEIQILPAAPSGVAPGTWQVPLDCGARTTLVLRDQEIVVLPGFPRPGAKVDVMTTVTPYVIWEDADLRRLAECKRAHAHTEIDPARTALPRSTPPATQ